ncbi:MAG TPA: hypothetical protein VH374_15550 [Polyangia bacterium]|jgi:hypothetical protein|nr:hypothetical protein [Polyangia bacterium]
MEARAAGGNNPAPINSNHDAAPTSDGPPAITDAQPISEAGQMGVIAPGVGQDRPSPSKPTVGVYMGKAQRDITFSAGSLDPAAKQGHGAQDFSQCLYAFDGAGQ